MIKLKYKTVKIVVDSDNIEKLFVVTKNRRQIRASVVDDLRRTMVSGAHFDSGLVANKKDNKFRLIDGNHRFEAMKLYLEKNPDKKIEIILNYYDDLSDKEEKEIYTKWNLGTKQNKNDFLNMYQDEIPILKWIKADFPCHVAIYNTKKGVVFGRMINAYFIATNSKNKTFSGLSDGPGAVNYAKSLSNIDYQYMYAYWAVHKAAFGDVEDNEYVNGTVLPSLMKIWWDNKGRIKPKTMVDMFKKRLFNKPKLLFWSHNHGTLSREGCYNDLKAMLNRGMRDGRFV